jgi:sporulation protein YlmC with PRC-barrel domain
MRGLAGGWAAGALIAVGAAMAQGADPRHAESGLSQAELPAARAAVSPATVLRTGHEGDATEGLPLRVSALMGRKVRNPQGEDLGRVEDVVLRPDATVSYVVLAYGGILGVGEKLLAVPWNEVHWAEGERHVLMNVARERFDELEGFDRDNWPVEPDFAAFMTERPTMGGGEPEASPPEGQQPDDPVAE